MCIFFKKKTRALAYSNNFYYLCSRFCVQL